MSSRYLGGIVTATQPTPTQASASGVWTVKEAEYYQKAGNWPPGSGTDPYFKYTTLLLHGDGTNGAQNNTFIDSSTNNFTVTRNGNTTQGSFDPYVGPGCWSNYFVSGSNTYLSSTGSAGTAMGTGNFTWECWVYSLGTSGYQDFIDTRSTPTVGSSDGFAFALNTGTLTPMIYTTSILLSSTVSITANAWNHVAVTRSGTTLTLWVNGVSGGSTTNSTNLSNQSFAIGSANTTGVQMNGYISNVRMVKGVALYTTAFTPPTSPLVATQQTTLLTCNGNGFIDQSATNNALTVVGTPLVSKFSPFSLYQNVPTSYSGYFDGTGDYLSIANSPAFNFGAADFTIEFWYYTNSTAGWYILGKGDAGTVAGSTFSWNNAVSDWAFYYNTNSTLLITKPSVDLGVWTHIAVVRQGGTITIYKNGTAFSSGVIGSGVINTTSSPLYIAGYSNLTPFPGSVSNFRIVKGTAVYTSAFTPTTAPLTATTTVSGSQSWSTSFDGSGDYLSIPNNTALTVGTGDFTIEAWVYGNTFATTNKTIWAQGNGGMAFYAALNTGKVGFEVYAGAAIILSTAALSANQWYHLAVTRSGTTVRLFINGALDTTATSSANFSSAAANNLGGDQNGAGNSFNGFISNFRLVKGQALYTAAFTPSTTPLTTTSQGATAANVSLLTCQNNIIEDNSNNLFAVKPAGDAKPSSANPFVSTNGIGGTSYSGAFNGSSQYLSVAANAAFNFGTSDFTIEAWIYTNSSATQRIISAAALSNQPYELALVNTGSNLYVDFYDGVSDITTGTNYVPQNQWVHIAISRSGTALKIFINGVVAGSATNSTSLAPTGSLFIGRYQQSALQYFSGYISNLRIVKGQALYTAAFSPTTVPLTTTSQGATAANVSLLTCQSTTFVDNSPNAFTITNNGSANTDVLNPFSGGTSLLTCQSTTFVDNSAISKVITANGDARPRVANPFTDTVTGPTPYATTTYGGSGYFDGSGDYLSVPDNAAWAYGTGDFTVEFWLNFSAFPTSGSYMVQVSQYVDANNRVSIFFGNNAVNENGLVFKVVTGGTVYKAAENDAANITMASLGYATNCWYHIAITRSGTSIKGFVNGVQKCTLTTSASFPDLAAPLLIGSFDGTQLYQNGYISNLRIIKGTAIYTAPFVPPAAPVTAVVNTQLLLNMTNGGIIDNTTVNDLETVGAAQINTSIVKYGTGSISFNGTNSYLTFPDNPANKITGDFTIEAWIYRSANANQTLFGFGQNTNGYSGIRLDIGSDSKFYVLMSANGTTWAVNLASTNTVSLTTWTHVAVVRSGSTVTLYINGVSNGTATASGAMYASTIYTVGVSYQTGALAQYYNGYIDEIRFTEGIARYTTNFTPPAGPFPNY